jgi:hypothetical protein
MMRRAPFLLHMLLALLATHGLAPETLDPWRGWVAFKRYARLVREVPDPGVSVQITHDPEHRTVNLFYVRQAIEADEHQWLEPLGGVVCEFTFPAGGARPGEWELWSFDSPTFERFVDRVEQHPEFADLMTQAPLRSAVYWEDA